MNWDFFLAENPKKRKFIARKSSLHHIDTEWPPITQWNMRHREWRCRRRRTPFQHTESKRKKIFSIVCSDHLGTSTIPTLLSPTLFELEVFCALPKFGGKRRFASVEPTMSHTPQFTSGNLPQKLNDEANGGRYSLLCIVYQVLARLARLSHNLRTQATTQIRKIINSTI